MHFEADPALAGIEFSTRAPLLEQLAKSKWLAPLAHRYHGGESYRPHELRFSCRIGPVYDLAGCLHDPLHLVEDFEHFRTRARQVGLGLTYKTVVTVLGRDYEEPLTAQGVRRELRVIALQSRVLEDEAQRLGLTQEAIDASTRGWVDSMHLMSDFLFYRNDGESQENALARAQVEVKALKAAIDLNVVRHQWATVCQWLVEEGEKLDQAQGQAA